MIKITGASPKDARATVELVLEEAPLRADMIDFAGRILLLSVMISLITAGLVFLSLNALMVRPMRRITASMMAFRRDPEDPAATLPHTSRADEIGMAQRELIDMQASLRAALRQKERLAALGTAVTKINHDLRNILSTAALVSERLASSEDPEVRRVTPRLMRSIDRAVELCSQTLAYSRDGVLPLRRSRIPLAELVDEVGTELTPRAGESGVSWINRVGEGVIVEADREQLSRALVNLGRNALEAGATEITVSANPDRRRQAGADRPRQRPRSAASRAGKPVPALRRLRPRRRHRPWPRHRAGGRPHPWRRYPAGGNQRKRYVFRDGTTRRRDCIRDIGRVIARRAGFPY